MPKESMPFHVGKVEKIIESRETQELIDCLTRLELNAVSIGEGGNAEVFAAEGTAFSKVCLKKIRERPQILSNDVDKEHEYQIRARQAGVPTPLSLISIEANSQKYIIMERITGHNILEILEKPSLLPGGFDYETFSMALKEAVRKMHAAELFHRDLHSKNVMVNENGLPVIIDFGTATIGSGSDFTYEESVSMYNPETKRYEQKTGYFKDDNIMVRNLLSSMKGVLKKEIID